jgi:hypothetical protein
MTRALGPRLRWSRLPLLDNQGPITAAELRRMADEAESERDAQRKLLADLGNPLLTVGPVLAFAVPNHFWLPNPDKRNVADWLWRKVCALAWNILKADGAREGATDLIILHRGTTRFCEMKRTKGGRLSEDQKRFRDDVRAAGGIWVQFNGYRDAVEYLTAHGVLRGGA